MIIAFTNKTSKIIPRIFCRRFRHCCVIFDAGRQKILVQIGIDGVRLIPVSPAAVARMQRNGWTMVEIKNNPDRPTINRIPHINILTCVGFAKRAAGIRNPFIWTPDGLYKQIR